MAKANVNIENVDSFRQGIESQRDSVVDSVDMYNATIDETKEALMVEKEKAVTLIGEVQSTLSVLLSKIEEQRAKVEELQASLASLEASEPEEYETVYEPDVTDDMTDTEKKDAKAKALEEATNLINQLKESENLETDFANLAKEKSDDIGTASQGGLLENITNETDLIKEFWEATLKLNVGEMTLEAVETEYGYHIIYKVSQKEKPALDSVKDKVIDGIIEELLSKSNSSLIYWAGLREKYNMVIHDEVIEDSYNSTMKLYKK